MLDLRALSEVYAALLLKAIAVSVIVGIALWEFAWWLYRHLSFSWN